MLRQHVEIREIRQAIDLVQHQQCRLVSAAQFLQDGVDRLDLLLGRGAGGIYDVQEQPGLPGFFQRGFETRDQVVWQLADEANRIAQENFSPIRTGQRALTSGL